MGKIIFTIIMVIWFIIGNIGIINAKSHKTNWFMIISLLFVPFIPLVAKVCGLC